MSVFANIAKIPELRRRILFTLGMLAVYRVGIFVTTPGVNRNVLQEKMAAQSGGFLGMATGKDETGYTWKNITTTDLLSPQDGGNGQLRNAKIIAILEDVGVWARKDPALGVGWRLAQAFIIPSDDRPVSDSRAANRSVDAYSGIFPGDMRFE